MKTSNIFIAIALLLFTTLVIAKGTLQKSTITVYGNCESCEKRIEKAALIKGVKSASWNSDTQLLTIDFDSKTVSISNIEKAIAASGHDTEHEKATDAAYNNLPHCCQYKRK